MSDNLQRLNYYTQNKYSELQNVIEIIVPENLKTFRRNEIYFYQGPNSIKPDDVVGSYGDYNHGWWWGNNDGMPLNIQCFSISADGINNNEYPSIQKVRKIMSNNNNAFLFPLEYGRHWNDAFDMMNNRVKKVNWEHKKDEPVFRGTLTGTEKIDRLDFCKLFSSKYNVGLLYNPYQYTELDYKDCTKDSVSINNMLKYKYIISIEGNDKDSGLNWKLASGSVVLMKKPVYESWLMEGRLIPYFHYVPLKDDYSDFEEILNWCKNNDSKCKEISSNAFNYMLEFNNLQNEKKLANEIKNFYSNHYKFE